MVRNIQFPFDLSEASIDEKKKYFINRTVNHPILNETFLEVMEKIGESPGGKVYQVFGPTGVGKSTVFKKVRSEILIKHQRENVNENNSYIPIAGIELPSPDNGKFNWKDFYKRLLKEMHEPLIENKVLKNNNVQKKNIPNHFPSTAPELRESLENAIIYRKTKVILLDEAQHLLKVASAKGINDQLDTIKSLANITNSIFIMFGTYELMDFFDLNGQLGRRTNEIHFRRYDIRNTDDIKIFKSILNTFQIHLPLHEESDLLKYWEFLYERSVGCIGILKEWLDECLKEAINKEYDSINYNLIKKHAPSPSKALKIAEETLAGEEKQDERGHSVYLLKEKLGIGLNGDLSKKELNKENKKKKDVGKRNPTRDNIGIKETGA